MSFTPPDKILNNSGSYETRILVISAGAKQHPAYLTMTYKRSSQPTVSRAQRRLLTVRSLVQTQGQHTGMFRVIVLLVLLLLLRLSCRLRWLGCRRRISRLLRLHLLCRIRRDRGLLRSSSCWVWVLRP